MIWRDRYKVKQIYKITVIAALLLELFSYVCYGALGEEYVRVRVRSPRLYNEQASLQGYGSITVYDAGSGFEKLFELEANKVNVLLDSYFDRKYNYDPEGSKASYGPHHVAIDNLYASYEEAFEESGKLEKKFDADFSPYLSKEGSGKFEIYGGFYTSAGEAKELLSELKSEGYSGATVSTNMGNIVVYDEDNNVVFMYGNNLSLYFSSYNSDEGYDMIKIDGKPYRGFMAFRIIENSKLISINYVDLESYLYGVVPNEISASWGEESLKAQAVAARTYAVSCLNPKASYGYDLDDNQNSQVYRGVISEKESTNNAVDDTRGEMIYYDNKLIQAFYHSTSGGSTENSENVWYEKLPYMVGVEDEYTNRSGSPYNEWQKSYKKEEIIKKLKDDGHNVKNLYGIEITKITKNNRVTECIFLTDIGEIVYYKENTRLVLGLMSSWFTIENGSVFYFTNEYTYDAVKGTSVPSRGGVLDSITEDLVNEEDTSTEIKLSSGNIDGKYAITSDGAKKISSDKFAVISSKGVSILESKNSEDYNFSGRGWGHGIGMSQYGAKQMAAEGFTYDEILKHYYTGVTIK